MHGSGRGEEEAAATQQGVAGRQIRWATVGRFGGIALAIIIGIASIPALLGSDRPPAIPPDVGLAPPPQTVQLAPPTDAPPASPAPAPQPGRSDRRLARRERPRERPLPRRERHPRERHRGHHLEQTPDQPAPVYSYSPPPSSSDNLGIEG
jgi:hypothetical protein